MTLRVGQLITLTAMGVLPSVAHAQDEAPDTGPLVECVAQGGAEACIGIVARACMAQNGPMSAGICTGAENAWWLAAIADATVQVSARGSEVATRAAQRAWPESLPTIEQINAQHEAYRDARCAWQMAAWDGIHAGFEGIDCEMRVNAAHALWLMSMAEGT